MPITDEQAKSIKEQLFKQIESFPEDKRSEIKEYITSMNNEQLEEFLIKNKMMGGEGEEAEGETENEKSAKTPQCIMCMISSKKIESLPIYEDKDYLAALEINPFSPGHIILIPKEHISETKSLKSKIFTIADKIGKHLVKKLEAENFQITSSDELKHALVNIIPTYKGKKLTFERKPAKKEELQEISMRIGKIVKKVAKPRVKKEKKEESKTEKAEEKSKSNIPKMNRRVP